MFTVVVVVVFTLTDRASTIPSNIRGCQSGTWSQRGTKVNGSHHGDNPLLRPTGIQIATKSYATLQAMAPTNNKTVHQTSFTPYREQPRSTRIVVAYPRPAFSHRWALWYLWNPWIMPVRGTPCTGTCNRPVGILWVIEPCAYPVRVSVFSQGSCRAILCLGVLPHACTLSKCAPLDYTQVCVALDFLCR